MIKLFIILFFISSCAQVAINKSSRSKDALGPILNFVNINGMRAPELDIVRNNNIYVEAKDQLTDYYASIGKWSGRRYKLLTCSRKCRYGAPKIYLRYKQGASKLDKSKSYTAFLTVRYLQKDYLFKGESGFKKDDHTTKLLALKRAWESLLRSLKIRTVKQTYLFDTRSSDLREVSRFLFKKRYHEAFIKLKELYVLNPSRKDIILNLAIIKHYFGDLSTAATLYKKVLSRQRTNLVKRYLESSIREQSLMKHYRVSL